MQTQTIHRIQIEPSEDKDTLSTSAVILWALFGAMVLDLLARWLA